MVTLERQLFTEVFPIDTQHLPQLYAYRPQFGDNEPAKIGGKLAYRMRQMFPGNWVWAGDRVVTDVQPNPASLKAAVNTLVHQEPSVYGGLVALEEDPLWVASAETLADYVARGPLDKLGDAMRDALAKTNFSLRNARVEREHRVKTWVVDGQPAVSFSIISHLIADVELTDYAKTVDKQTDLIGVQIADKSSTLQGQILKVVGTMGEHRKRLLGLTQREAMRNLLQNAPDDELVVKVSSGRNEYDYAASALRVMVGLSDIGKFGLDPQHAAKALRMKPGLRAQMVKIVADIAKSEKLVSSAFSTVLTPEPFTTLPQDADVVFGGNRTRRFDPEQSAFDYEQYGAYWTRERFTREPVKVAIINSLQEPIEDFVEAMRRYVVSDFGYEIDVVRERKVKVVSPANLEAAVRVLQKEPIDLILVFVENQAEEEDEDTPADRFVKAQIVGRGFPCLVIHQSTLHKPEAMVQLVMGIFARAGNAPFLFDEPLPYADYVVGLDLVRQGKKDATAMTGLSRIYRSDGALLCAVTQSGLLSGNVAIPEPVLEALLPADLFAGARVIIHTSSPLRRDEQRTINAWAERIGAELYMVEVLQRGAPRLYALEAGKISNPPKGSVFRLNEREAFIITSGAPDDATPQPVHVRTLGNLGIDEALHSVAMFTLLHYGALKTPKLPVTVHNADYLRATISRGLMTEASQRDVPFWL
jgi:hypothetical protein